MVAEIPKAIYDELMAYIKSRTSKDILEEDRLAVGTYLKPPILRENDIEEESNPSDNSKRTVRIYEIREGKMQEVQGMPEFGKEPNSRLQHREHLGKKRIYVP